MRYAFYDSKEYKERQRKITEENTKRGVYSHLRKRQTRRCSLPGCINQFEVKPADPKRFCSQKCGRKGAVPRPQTAATRKKISDALRGRPATGPRRAGAILVARTEAICANPRCGKTFLYERYKNRSFCSVTCAIKTIGSRPTSPKASRGKSGIRLDISDTLNFHSTWEANVARMYTHLGIEWLYEPKTFDIGGHTYTPDFYLPKYDEYLEVKNFWSSYSAERDKKFRMTHPRTYLRVLLRDEYFALQELYGRAIPNWEFSGRR